MTFHLKRKLYTTDPKFKFASSFDRIEAIQSLTKGLQIGITHVEYLDPTTIKTKKREDGRRMVDWTWLRSLPTGRTYTSIGLHVTPKDRGKLKLAGTIKGAYRNSKQPPIYFYVIAGTAKEFERRLLHEEGHGFEDLGVMDTTGLTKNQKSVGPLHYFVLNRNPAGFYRRVSFL